jgi:hypothetical protein
VIKSIYVGCNPVGSFLGVMLIEVYRIGPGSCARAVVDAGRVNT